MNFIVDKSKALKKWAPVLDTLRVEDEDKRTWMAEYAEMHQMNENISYSTLGNLNGMGAVAPPTPWGTPGAVWNGADSGVKQSVDGSGDIAQNLLPVSMKIAAQTIGLDLLAVKPSSSPRIELLFVDFKYDNNADGTDRDERPLVFKIDTNIAAQHTLLRADLAADMATASVTETIGGLTSRMFFSISGTTTVDTYYDATYKGRTFDATTSLIEPTVTEGRQGWLEFLGFSRIDGKPMFRTFKQIGAPVSGAYPTVAARNTFDVSSTDSVTTL